MYKDKIKLTVRKYIIRPIYRARRKMFTPTRNDVKTMRDRLGVSSKQCLFPGCENIAGVHAYCERCKSHTRPEILPEHKK